MCYMHVIILTHDYTHTKHTHTHTHTKHRPYLALLLEPTLKVADQICKTGHFES